MGRFCYDIRGRVPDTRVASNDGGDPVGKVKPTEPQIEAAAEVLYEMVHVGSRWKDALPVFTNAFRKRAEAILIEALAPAPQTEGECPEPFCRNGIMGAGITRRSCPVCRAQQKADEGTGLEGEDK